MSTLHTLADQGQAIWLDFIRRGHIASGELQSLIDQGLRGVTSNPTIFEKAIAGSHDYDEALVALARQGKTTQQIYEHLAMDDIRRAADLLRPVYEQTGCLDGFVSMEVSPTLAHNTQATLEEAQRLFRALDRPNIMIKIPATPEGLPAITSAIAMGINVNVTLIFSLSQYESVAKAYLAGLEKRAASGDSLAGVASVASFFISRIDSAVDQELARRNALELLGKTAIASAKLAYERFTALFSGASWQKLAAAGAQLQRPLWASTGVKNSAYPDTMYVDELIASHTVNTLPPQTLQAVLDHGKTAPTIQQNLAQAHAHLASLASLGIQLDSITQKLMEDGVTAFSDSFAAMMNSIEEKRVQVLQAGYSERLGSAQATVAKAIQSLQDDRVVERIWAIDHTVWKDNPAEISNRLGWLRVASDTQAAQPRLQALSDELRAAGYTHALLLGMGGSSLAPEVLRQTFGVQTSYLDLAVLDSTDPIAVLRHAETLDPSRTLYIVSTKSGGTVETFSFLKYFYNHVARTLGKDKAGAHFMAITDPGSKLEEIAAQLGFRAVFLNDPNIGGRYSALSFFGMAPAALAGLDVDELLNRALAEAAGSQSAGCRAARLGAVIGELAKQGKDKLTLIISPALCSFGIWVEQLVAESTGKEGKGILPVVGEAIAEVEDYGQDRLFVYIQLAGDHTFDVPVQELESAGYPVVHLRLNDLYDLGAQFFLWELATAIACQRLGINPFDQPNVESAKVQARKLVAAFQQEGQLPEPAPTFVDQGISVVGALQAASLEEAWQSFLRQAAPGAYISLQAYITPTEECDASLISLASALRKASGLAVTTGYGPRFLHSTGQLHKGDAGCGLFVQLTSDNRRDADIPDEAGQEASSISFGVLKNAQALGDRQALLDAGRPVIRFHLGEDPLVGLARLTQAL